MLEVDATYSIVTPWAVWWLSEPIIGDLDFDNIGCRVNRKEALKGIHDEALDICKDQDRRGKLFRGRFRKYRLYQETLSEGLEQICGYTTFLTSIATDDEEHPENRGRDLLSNSFLFSSRLPELGDRLHKNFLREVPVILWPISPVDIMVQLKYLEKVDGFVNPINAHGIEAVLKENIFDINRHPKVNIGFGSVAKWDQGSKVGNFTFPDHLFDAEKFETRVRRYEFMFADKIEDAGGLEPYIQRKRDEAAYNRLVMAVKYARILERSRIVEDLFDLGLERVPLFSAKTSAEAKIFETVSKILDYDCFEFVGGEQGPLATADMSSLGINHESAIQRFFGMVLSLNRVKYNHEGKAPTVISSKVRKPFVIEPHPKYPFLLMEKHLHDRHPNMADMYEQFSQKDQDILRGFLLPRAAGLSRIEVRLYELMNGNYTCYLGSRKRSKVNLKWQEEVRGKKIVFPLIEDDDLSSAHMRGSSFVLSCPIQRAIASVPEDVKKAILFEQLKNEDLAKAFFENHDPQTLDSFAATRGTLGHHLINEGLEGLVHYETLKEIGHELPSTHYAERSILLDYRGVRVSMHPDAFFVLENDGKQDVVVFDIKTNRHPSYPILGYMRQGRVYGQGIAQKLGIHPENIYVVIDHLAYYPFYGKMNLACKDYGTYRSQQFVITKYPWVGDDMDEIREEILETRRMTVDLHEDLEVFRTIRENKSKKKQKGCSACFDNIKLICDYWDKHDELYVPNT